MIINNFALCRFVNNSTLRRLNSMYAIVTKMPDCMYYIRNKKVFSIVLQFSRKIPAEKPIRFLWNWVFTLKVK